MSGNEFKSVAAAELAAGGLEAQGKRELEVLDEIAPLVEELELAEVHQVYGGIELGGTKTVVAIGDGEGKVIREERFPTTEPEETLGRAVAWLRENGPLAGLGVASFGPIRVRREAGDFGTMLNTPKEVWQGFPVLGYLSDAFPTMWIGLETDVNAAALAEARLGAAVRVEDLVYITIGTGIGGGVLSGGRLIHGVIHPEFGHLKTPRAPGDDFPGACPFHGDCLEGMASGPAIRGRWKMPGHELGDDHPAWEMEAWYLAHGILALLAVVSPQRVIVGGGVSQAAGLHEKINRVLKEIAADYFPAVTEHAPFVVGPGLGQDAGILGALLLASGGDR